MGTTGFGFGFDFTAVCFGAGVFFTGVVATVGVGVAAGVETTVGAVDSVCVGVGVVEGTPPPPNPLRLPPRFKL